MSGGGTKRKQKIKTCILTVFVVVSFMFVITIKNPKLLVSLQEKNEK